MVQDRSIRGKNGQLDGSVAFGGKTVPTPQRGFPEGTEPSSSGDQINVTWLKYNRMPRTWVEYNERIFAKHRALAVKDEHGDYHPECADGRNISLESWNPGSPNPVSIILPAGAPNIARAQGLTCTHCGEYIIFPTLASGLSPAETEFRRVNDAYLSGLVSKEEWIVAVQAWANSPENPDNVNSPEQVESQLESEPLSESEELDLFMLGLIAIISEHEGYGLDEGNGDQLAIDLGSWVFQTATGNHSTKLVELGREILEAIDRYNADKLEDMRGESNLVERLRYIMQSV